MDSSRKTFLEVVLSSALGAGIATVAAVALGFPWWPAAIIGVGIGAFFCFRPRETAEIISSACRILRAGFDLSPKERVATRRTGLLFMWGICIVVLMVEEMTIALVATTVPRNTNIVETLVMGALIAVLIVVIFGGLVFAVADQVYKDLRNQPQVCGFFFLRTIDRIVRATTGLRLRNESRYRLRRSDNSRVLDYFDERGEKGVRACRVATLLALSVVFIFLPVFATVAFGIITVDVAVWIALALASKPRLAVMWGTMIGGTIGYFVYVANPMLPIATFVGMLAGGASGGALYCVRVRIVAALKTA